MDEEWKAFKAGFNSEESETDHDDEDMQEHYEAGREAAESGKFDDDELGCEEAWNKYYDSL